MRPFLFLLAGAALAAPPAVDGLLAQYTAAGAQPFDAARGEALWNKTFPDPEGGAARACTTCHGPALSSAGEHVKTGEPIDPMNAAGRLADAEKIEKWFGRNCRWTYGHECTPQEKGDFLLYLTGGAK